jgi:homoserine O-acetyltransferase
MDLYDVAAGYERAGDAYARISAEMLFVGISSDWLFYPGEVRKTAEVAREAGADARYVELDTDSGHDAFLKDWQELRRAVEPLMDKDES